jgi:hypothetical protein
MTGTQSQIEWAEQIKPRVGAEFDRVATAFASHRNTEAILAILQEKRAEVMANESAGYFIRDWQELTDQVRQMIHKDPRYQAIRASRQINKSKEKLL